MNCKEEHERFIASQIIKKQDFDSFLTSLKDFLDALQAEMEPANNLDKEFSAYLRGCLAAICGLQSLHRGSYPCFPFDEECGCEHEQQEANQ